MYNNSSQISHASVNNDIKMLEFYLKIYNDKKLEQSIRWTHVFTTSCKSEANASNKICQLQIPLLPWKELTTKRHYIYLKKLHNYDILMFHHSQLRY